MVVGVVEGCGGGCGKECAEGCGGGCGEGDRRSIQSSVWCVFSATGRVSSANSAGGCVSCRVVADCKC